MPQFRDSFYGLVPPWLSTGDAEKYFYTLELMRDLLMEKSNQAQKIRLPGQGDSSQIPFLAHDRQLVQGPLEPDASFILRLREAFPTWNEAGSAPAVLGQLQCYAQGRQVDRTEPEFAIVSNPRTLQGGAIVNTWWTLNYDDPIGTKPLLSMVPENFDWDGNNAATWRAWLVIYQHLDFAPSHNGASITAAGDGSFVLADLGEEVDGVWVPKTSGTAVNAPFLTVAGLAGLSVSDVGKILALAGSVNANNNGSFQIARVLSSTSCVIVNPSGAVDAGPLTWTVAAYPWMPPGPAWGTPGLVWGEGEGTPPQVDTGSNVGGVWQPTELVSTGERPAFSWGLYVDSLEIVTIRELVRTWKSTGTYYPNIIICYGDEYSRTSSGAGNPDGSFGEVGYDPGAGVWVPTRALASPWDCYCQGTGRAVACSLENMS